MRRIYFYGGIVASIALVVFGAVSVYSGFDGRDRVRSDLAREQIVGTPDSAIPNQKVDTGKEAEAFAATMRKHTLEITGGQTYAQMPRYVDKGGKPVSMEQDAAIVNGKPAENPARQIWVTETALSTALQTAYFAESVSTFVIAMGVALLLAGTGFLVLVMHLRPGAATARARAGEPVTA